jgi:hypothetical protein
VTTEPASTRRSSGALTAVAVAALVGAGLLARMATGAEPPSTPVRGSSLGGIACAGATCVAVGTTGSVYGVETPFAVVAGGGDWTPRAPVGPAVIGNSTLEAVACSSPDSCVAVGREELPTPFFGSRSTGDRPLAEAWDGARWRRLSAGVPPDVTDAGLEGVDCVATGCMAVGDLQTRKGKDHALAESWDGRRWTLRPLPTIRQTEEVVLEDVACTSTTSCVAVGHVSDETLFGGIVPLIERWNGTAWIPERSANAHGSTDTELGAVDCPSADRCTAVGFRRLPDGRYGTFAESWDGTTWRALPARDPAGSPDTELADVACPLPDHCVAVGTAVLHGAVTTFAESWDGTRWTIEPAPAPAGSTSSALSAVDCTASAPSVCRAAGISWHGSPIGTALAEDRTPAGWAIRPVPVDAAGVARA